MLWSAFVPFTRRTPGFSAGFSLVLVGVGVADLDLSSLSPFFMFPTHLPFSLLVPISPLFIFFFCAAVQLLYGSYVDGTQVGVSR